MAGRLSTDWYVVYVETPSEAPQRIDATAQRHLHDNIEMARELGAEVVRLKAGAWIRSRVDAGFRALSGIAHIIAGRSNQPWWKRLLGLGWVFHRLVREAGGLDVHVVSTEDAGDGA